MPASTANWHWKNKNVTTWAKQWFQRELTALIVKGDAGEEVSVSEVVEVEGDVELGQRKSKYVSFDQNMLHRREYNVDIAQVDHHIRLQGRNGLGWKDSRW